MDAVDAAAPRVLLGVAGGIAAYKACELLRCLTEKGHAVRVLPTASALRFVGAATFEALSGQPVRTGVFADVPEVPHVRLGQEADLVVVAPATADLLARIAHGRADDLLAAALLTARCPTLLAPAMHTEMWEHPATRDNVAVLRSRGVVVMEPASGRQGYALARVAAQRGAAVTLVAAHTAELGDPAAVDVVRVGSAMQMREAVLAAAKGADAVVMAAAVADFRPSALVAHKIKKGSGDPEPLALTRNPDILVELVAARVPGQVIVGFAAETGDETGDVLHYGRAKLARKGADLLVVNAVGDGRAFEVPDNAGWLLSDDAGEGSETELASGSKALLASRVWDAVAARLRAARHPDGGSRAGG